MKQFLVHVNETLNQIVLLCEDDEKKKEEIIYEPDFINLQCFSLRKKTQKKKCFIAIE
jgi:hypothetical protein